MPKRNQHLKSDLSIEARVRSALKLYKHENPHSVASVASICRMAGVSRANLYESHPDLVKVIREPKVQKSGLDSASQKRTTSAAKIDLSTQNKALLYICLELKAELEAVRAKEMSSQTKRKLKNS